MVCCCLDAKSCPILLRLHGLYVAYQAPLSIGFPKQEYWSGLPFPSPGVLPDPGIESECPALQAGALLLGHVSALVIISLLSMSVTLFLFCKHLFVLF